MSHDQLRDDPEHPAVRTRDTVYEGAIWDIVRETFSYGDSELRRDFVDHPGASAVVALDDENRVLLVRQYRHPVRSRNWELPAGLLDMPGEDPADAAHRELAKRLTTRPSPWTTWQPSRDAWRFQRGHPPVSRPRSSAPRPRLCAHGGGSRHGGAVLATGAGGRGGPRRAYSKPNLGDRTAVCHAKVNS